MVVSAVAHSARGEGCLGMGQRRPRRNGQRGGDLQRGQHLTPVAAAALDEQVDGVVGGVVCQRPRGRDATRTADRRVERLEAEQRRAAAQRRVDLEERVLGRGPDQDSVPSSTAGSRASCWALLKRWISSRNRIVPLVVLAEPLAGPLDDLAHVLDAGVDRRHLLEGPLRSAGDGEGERGLAGAGRSPEQHR